MTPFTSQELDAVGGADELGISSERPDGTDRPFVTIWTVRAGDDLYVRSAYGADNPWYRRALRSGSGRIRAGGVDRAVTFVHLDPGDPVQTAIDDAYQAKYDRYPPRIVGSVVGPTAHLSTIRLEAR